MNAMNRARTYAHRAGRDLAYVAAVLPLSIVGFVLWVTGVTVTASLLVLIVGGLAWLASARAFRAAASVDRRVAGWYLRTPIRGVYREQIALGPLDRLRVVTTDPQTRRDLIWLIVNSTIGFILATVALTATGLVISYVLMPLWWWAISDPHTQYATLNLGIYTVTSTGWALLTTALGLALVVPAALINRVAATSHARLAARLLGPRRWLARPVQAATSSSLAAVRTVRSERGGSPVRSSTALDTLSRNPSRVDAPKLA